MVFSLRISTERVRKILLIYTLIHLGTTVDGTDNHNLFTNDRGGIKSGIGIVDGHLFFGNK